MPEIDSCCLSIRAHCIERKGRGVQDNAIAPKDTTYSLPERRSIFSCLVNCARAFSTSNSVIGAELNVIVMVSVLALSYTTCCVEEFAHFQRTKTHTCRASGQDVRKLTSVIRLQAFESIRIGSIIAEVNPLRVPGVGFD